MQKWNFLQQIQIHLHNPLIICVHGRHCWQIHYNIQNHQICIFILTITIVVVTSKIIMPLRRPPQAVSSLGIILCFSLTVSKLQQILGSIMSSASCGCRYPCIFRSTYCSVESTILVTLLKLKTRMITTNT